MSIASQVVARMYGIGPAEHRVRIERNIGIAASDGEKLMTDMFTPRTKGPHPTLLMRTPYGRFGFSMVAEIYAERGFRTLLQACRGTDGSGGTFDPLINEREDGLATLDWIVAQEWFDGRLGLTGPSYLGYAQWAICDALPAGAAMSAKCTASDFEDIAFPGGAFHLQLWLSWIQTVFGLENELMGMTLRMMTGDVERRTADVGLTLPLLEADVAAVGEEVPFWRVWFRDAIGNADFWAARDHSHRLGSDTPPNTFVTGWYDLMLDGHMRDYEKLVAAGQAPHLTIGPWHHTDNELQGECLRQTISWMNHHLMEKPDSLREHPVRIFVSGKNEWHDLDDYPPPTAPRTLNLQPEGGLADTTPPDAPPDRYRYDPADPTPNLGGAIFAFTGAGAVDNGPLEARNDVLVYTGAPLEADLTVLGNAVARLCVESSCPSTDFFVRLCDVDPGGKSTNICDGIVRLAADHEHPDKPGPDRIHVRLHSSAHCFLKGHRIRLQVSSGAHPRYARNLGIRDTIGHGTELVAADQAIFHDPANISSITLPVWMDVPTNSDTNRNPHGLTP